jgi:preprotein translocase subunit SecF
MPSFAKFGNDLYAGRRSVGFIAHRRIWYSIAVAACVISILALAILHLNPGIEFRGGTEFDVPSVAHTSEITGANAVHSVVPDSEALVTKIGSNTMRVETEKLLDKDVPSVQAALAKAYDVPVNKITTSFVGASWGSDITKKAIQGLIVFLILVAVVIAGYFRTWKMAASALIALLHDLLLTVGIYALTGFEVSPASVIGFLTILGYSLYDTVVVFDKVRENTADITHSTRRTFDEAANLAVNQTLVRSINTSVVALLPVGSILFIGAFLLGAGTLKDISLALFVGIAAGTYSSIFIATPLLVDLRRREPEIVAHTQKILRRRAENAAKQASVTETGALDVDSVQDRSDGSDTVAAGVSGSGGGAGDATTSSGRATGTRAASGAGRSGAGGQRRQQPRRDGRSRSGGRRK